MVNISKSENSIKFVFTDSDHYLYGNGVVDVPVNSLLLVIDESDMVTFKKLSGDPFLSFRADNSNLGTKAAIEQFYKDNMVGSTGGGSESGITPSEVQTMIDESISGKADTSDVTAVANDVSTLSGQVATKVATTDFNAYSATTDARLAEDEEVTAAALNDLADAVSGKADTSAVTAVANDVQTVSGQVATKVATSDFNTYSAATATAIGNKQDALTAGQGIDITNNVISSTVDITVDPTLDSGSTNPVANSAITTALDGKQDISKLPNSIYSNSSSYGSKRYLSFVKMDKRTGTASTDLLSFARINDKGLVGSNDVFSLVETSAITSAITSGSTDDEIPSAKATYDAITAATTGGGATYNAGTNISIDTANTINCTLPITANTSNLQGYLLFGSNISVWGSESNGRYQIVIGKQISNPAYAQGQVAICPADTSSASNSVLTGDYPIGIGHMITSRGNGAVAIGDTANANGNGYVAIGQRVNATGTTKMNLNNQIKVDTNNQVYIKDKTNTTDVCIQDAIAALGGLKLVKLSQSEYDQLATKDPDTLYIISNVVS